MSNRALFLSLFFVPSLAACGDSTGSGGGGGGSTDTDCAPAIGCPAVQSDCIAFEDNAGKDTFTLRISDLTVTAPTALTDPTVSLLLSTGITMNYPSCTSADGFPFFTKDGTFNWLLQFDKTGMMLTTGGAAVETDPTKGYCFLQDTISGFDVAPLVTGIDLAADGTFSVTAPADVTVPVFTDKTDLTKVILLPLHSVRIFDGTISADNNCIGTLNPDLDPGNLCLPTTDTPGFVAGAKLEGYITLEEADTVLIAQLSNSSLCRLISGETGTTCSRDANNKIVFQGDWCAGTAEGDPGKPADATCADAVKLSAGFAASGVKLRSDCN